MTRVAHAGVGGWGRNVARVVGELADLAWICDTNEELQAQYAARYPQARVTGAFEDMLADDTVDAVVIATPVPTHHALAKQALQLWHLAMRQARSLTNVLLPEPGMPVTTAKSPSRKQ